MPLLRSRQKNLQINQEEKSEIPALLKQENIIKGDATPIDPQFAPFLNQEDSPLETESVDTSSTAFVPDPQPTIESVRKQQEENAALLPRNRIAEEVEEETEDTVPGRVNLTRQDDIVLSGDPDYEQEFLDTYGTPMVGNIETPSLARPGEMERGLGDRLTREKFALDNNIPLDQIGEIYPKNNNLSSSQQYNERWRPNNRIL